MRRNKSKQNTLIKGALWLTLAGVIGKILSAGYRIPLQNLTGDMGFYVYQQIYPFLSVIAMLALYGLPSAVSQLAYQMKSQGYSFSWRSFYLPLLVILILASAGICVLFFLNAENLAYLAGDVRLTPMYKLVAFLFLFIPFPALLRGVFQGMGWMEPTALSQMGEQFVRVSVIITVAISVYMWNIPVYNIGKAAVGASVIGLLAASVILITCFICHRPITRGSFKIPWQYYTTVLIILGTTAALNHMVLVIMQLADTVTLIPALKTYGLSAEEAKQAKGVFDRGQPLIQFGSVLGSSFAVALLPVISGGKLKEIPEKIYQSIHSSLLISFYLAMGASVGLIMILPETNLLLFQDTEGTRALRVLSIAILLSSLGMTSAAILQGLGYMKRTAVFVLMAFLLKWAANAYFVPLFGITGSSLATVLSLALFAGLMMTSLRKKLPNLKALKQINWLALSIALAGMMASVLAVRYMVGSVVTRPGLAIEVIVFAVTGAVIYFGLLLRFRAFTTQDLSGLPFSRVFIRLHKERNDQ